MRRPGHHDPTVSLGHAGAAEAPADTVGQGAESDDFEKYLVHLAHLDMPLPMKIELIRVVGDIMQSFVDRAFGDDPVQQALGVDRSDNKISAPADSELLEFEKSKNNTHSLSDTFRPKARKRRKRKEKQCL